jgi:hypothetical protein
MKKRAIAKIGIGVGETILAILRVISSNPYLSYYKKNLPGGLFSYGIKNFKNRIQ